MRFILICLLAVLPVFAGEIRAEDSYELTFVASAEDLAAALAKGDALRGFAVRSEFYDGSGEKSRKEIDKLVLSIQNNLRPIFIYGPGARLEILEAWYPKVKGFFKCKPTAAGVFSTIPINEKLVEEVVESAGGWTGANFLICDPYEGATSEKDFRDRIDGFWRGEKAR